MIEKEYMVKELLAGVLAIIIIIAILLGSLYGVQTTRNKASDGIWNNGICKACDQRFIPYGVNNGVKYYVCYGCGTEVVRY